MNEYLVQPNENNYTTMPQTSNDEKYTVRFQMRMQITMYKITFESKYKNEVKTLGS